MTWSVGIHFYGTFEQLFCFRVSFFGKFEASLRLLEKYSSDDTRHEAHVGLLGVLEVVRRLPDFILIEVVVAFQREGALLADLDLVTFVKICSNFSESLFSKLLVRLLDRFVEIMGRHHRHDPDLRLLVGFHTGKRLLS